PFLGAADYKLAYHTASGRGAYTFCMCPGGVVVASASEQEGVVTNGMSCYARDGVNANSALLVTVTPDDYQSYGAGPLCGVAFQRDLEHKAFLLGGGDWVPCPWWEIIGKTAIRWLGAGGAEFYWRPKTGQSLGDSSGVYGENAGGGDSRL
ncbi:MAG: FAD-dependent protein, partial [Hydrogeniiclostridium mannosilyticum]